MAAVFTLAWLVVLVGFGLSVWAAVYSKREDGRVAWPAVPLVLIFTLLLAYLAVKLMYEEILPCLTVDERYCEFSSTQYWNLFGWEF